MFKNLSINSVAVLLLPNDGEFTSIRKLVKAR